MDLLKALGNKSNQAILSLLRAEPTYARKAATLLDLSESEVTRRLRLLEKVGLVTSTWSHIGKNVKLYELASHTMRVEITGEGLDVRLGAKAAGVTIASAPVRIPDPGHIVGRAQEMALLDRRVAVVSGLPGIGKTTLVAAFARAQERPVFWYAFRGIESLDWLANRLGVFLARHGDASVLESLDMEPAEKRERMLAGLAGPTMVVFDDVHLVADPHVRAFLQDATEHANRLVLIGRDPFVALDHVRLEGLGDAAVAALLAAAGHDAALVPRIQERFGGHPLAIHLALEASARGAPLEEVLESLPAEGLDAYLLNEIDSSLRESERRFLAAASVFRGEFSLREVRHLARVHRKDVLALTRHGLVLDRGDRHALHEVVRTFFYNRLATKQEMHAKAAGMYIAKDTTEGHLEAMHHFQAGGHQERVLELLERNLDLREFDFVDAGYTNLYLQMLRLLDQADVTPYHRALIEDEKGDIFLHRGEPAVALDHYARARELFVDAGSIADVDWKRALALGRLGRVEEAHEVCQEAMPTAAEHTRGRLEELLAALPVPQ